MSCKSKIMVLQNALMRDGHRKLDIMIKPGTQDLEWRQVCWCECLHPCDQTLDLSITSLITSEYGKGTINQRWSRRLHKWHESRSGGARTQVRAVKLVKHSNQ